MGWFDEQIRERKLQDQQAFEEGFASIAGAVLGRHVAPGDESQRTKSAIEEILRYYHAKSREVPDSVKDFNEQLEFLLRPYGIMRRTVTLEKGWYKDAMGAILAFRKDDGAPTAMIPTGLTGYTSAVPAPARRFFAYRVMLLGLPPGWKPSPGSNIMQMPVKDSSKVSMLTDTMPRAGSFSMALSPLNPSNTTKWLKFQWMIQGNVPFSFRSSGSNRYAFAVRP